ncbi:MAG: phage tail sheath subtilisin-like domain-containing protein [Candidatus Accumulibacter phosphatis]|nr:phage tail sheath subtilisin-like domain-containing protein [Candidatus Accumulibacter phosphatis]
MVQVTYPGVYIQEVSSGVHTITSVGTSITAFIDFFREGPTDEAVEIFGTADFQRIYGGLDDRSEAGYAIAQYFLNGGSSALVVRVANGEAVASAALHMLPAPDEVLLAEAANAGRWGNHVRIDVDYATVDPEHTFNLAITRYDSNAANAKPLASERYLNLTMDTAQPRYAVKVVNDSSKLIKLRAGSAATSSKRPAASGTLGAAITPATLAALNALSGKQFKLTLGALPTRDATLVDWSVGGKTVSTLAQLRGYIEQAIRTSVSGTTSVPAPLAGATVEVVGTNRLRVLTSKTATGYSPTDQLTITDFSGADTTAADLGFDAAAVVNVQQYPLGSGAAGGPATVIAALVVGTTGSDGTAPGATDLIGNPALNTGIYALDRVDLFNILCIPRAVADGVPETDTLAIYSAALAFCELKRAFLLIDVPTGIDETQEVKDWLDKFAGLRHRNSAVYFPRTQVPDPVNDFRLRSIAASGTMAGIYARTDSQRGVWKAPAGIEAVLNGVAQLDAKLTDAENGVLNPLAINCLRTFPVYGGVAWGARTLVGADQMASEWKYVPIRRLALMLEESLFRGTKWVVFEPNDEPLWAKIRLNVGAYMNSLFRQGAFQGATPKEAYFVKCDGETTNQDDRNKGIVNIQVGFAPLKPAEFVVISIQQIAGDL